MDYVLKSTIHDVIGETILADIRSQRSAYYFFVGGVALANTQYSTTADPSYNYELATRNEICSLKKIQDSDVSFVIPRIDWTTGTVYDMFDDYTTAYPAFSGATIIDDAQFYVVTSNYQVYKCLFNNNNAPSTVMPASTLSAPFYTSDGYRWKFMYSIPLSSRTRFMNTAFIPVQTALTSNFYSAGEITTTALLNKGVGYTTASILIDGDGTGAILTPILSGGQIIQVIVTNAGVGYTYANLTVSGDGSGAVVVATLSVGDLDTSQADVELLAVRGSLEAFRMITPGAGYSATGVPTTGTADGVSTAYQLTDGGAVVSPNLFSVVVSKTNWQGKVPMYKTARTNVFHYSQAFSNSYWAKTQCAIVDANATGPDGTLSASTVTLQASVTNSYWGLVDAVTSYAAQQMTFSIYLKAGTLSNTVSVFLRDGAGANWGAAQFNLIAGTVINSNGSSAIQSMGNGWYRCSVSGTFGAAVGIQCYVDPADTGASGETYFAFGAQLETGLVATTYISTTTAPVTRTDILSVGIDGSLVFGTVVKAGDILSWAGTYNNGFGGTTTVTNSPVVPKSGIILPSVTITGDGTGALAHPVISNGQIIAILVDDPGQDYTFATITINGNGSGATAIPVLAPYGGHGKYAISELFATQLSFFSNILNDTNQGLQVTNQFRQIGIIRNPQEYGTDRFYTSLLASGCMLITYTGPVPQQNDLLTEINSGKRFRAISVLGQTLLAQNLDNYDLPGDSILLNNNSGGQITELQIVEPDIDKYSGDLIFIDNFSINQQPGQQLIIFKTTLQF